MDLTPIFRKEFFLDAIINSTTPPEPIFREEFFLAKIAGADVVTPTPIFRIEKYLAKIGGDDVEIPDPVFREEYWLAKKCGENVTTPTPVFRLEYFLEEWVNGSAPAYQTLTGKIVSFLTRRAAPLKIEASLSPIQDLNGQDAPWPPGGGKNKVPKGANRENGGITYTVQDNGEVLATGTATATSFWGVQFTIPAGTYILNGCPQTGGNSSYRLDVRDAIGGSSISGINADNGSGSTFTISEELTAYLNIRIASGYACPTGGLKLSPMIRLSSVSDPTFAPYSNECPITGHTGAEVWDDPAYGGTINWNQMFESTVTAEWDGITTEYDSTTNAIKITNNSRTTNYGTGSSRNSLILGNDLIIGHKYLQAFYPETDGVIAVRTGNVALPTIFTCEYQQNVILRITSDYKFTTDHPVGDVTSVWFNFYDLTEMFGAGNEPSTVADFKALFPKDYYAYNAGEETCVSAVNGDPYVQKEISFGQTVYGGTLTVNEDGTGSVKARPYYASYNGETLVGPWVSSMDAYAPGTTPTTGAQVVDMGGTETTIPLTPGQVEALQGNNTVWVDDSGEIKVTYRSN